ncbi:aldehyde dehydrogenase family protein [Arthrobacter sp. 2RAF6]|uniref:aldehyde dehydrogenase family protein n=1 Tax=Arthrobacter sp. 2RAF6 TaxID=3233002 RepID=UPI003F91DBF6
MGTGNGGHLTSANPSRPEEIVAEGGVAVLEDLDTAVLAARASQRAWAWNRTPIHERGAVLSRAAATLESQAHRHPGMEDRSRTGVRKRGGMIPSSYHCRGPSAAILWQRGV